MAKLKASTHVLNPDTNAYEVFGPDDKLPGWASKALKDNKVVWEDEKQEPSAEAPPVGPETADILG